MFLNKSRGENRVVVLKLIIEGKLGILVKAFRNSGFFRSNLQMYKVMHSVYFARKYNELNSNTLNLVFVSSWVGIRVFKQILSRNWHLFGNESAVMTVHSIDNF